MRAFIDIIRSVRAKHTQSEVERKYAQAIHDLHAGKKMPRGAQQHLKARIRQRLVKPYKPRVRYKLRLRSIRTPGRVLGTWKITYVYQ